MLPSHLAGARVAHPLAAGVAHAASRCQPASHGLGGATAAAAAGSGAGIVAGCREGRLRVGRHA